MTPPFAPSWTRRQNWLTCPADDTRALVQTLCEWIDRDVKATPLKALQGMIWKKGYIDRDYVAHLYPDARQWLAARHAEGVPMYVYSSGSIAAQDLYFHYNEFGDLRPWFQGFFSTPPAARRRKLIPTSPLPRKLAGSPAQIVFFSDSPDELDAAAEAGMIAVQICRDGPGTLRPTSCL